MASIKDAIRMCKRIMLTNLFINDYSIAVTPLLSGKHGIGKSQVAKFIAKELDGTVMIIEGGTLKEGEITGIPYQYKNENGDIEFRFLPYYIVQRIQKAEQFLYQADEKADGLDVILDGDENKYSVADLTFEQKVELIQTGKVKPVSKQIAENSKVEISAFKDGVWIRLEGELVEDDRVEAKKSMLDAYPELRGMYDENDDNTQVLYFKNGKATFCSFGAPAEVIEF